MLTCGHCFMESTVEEGDFMLDKQGSGYWCEMCDGYTYFSHFKGTKHRFTLILEDKMAGKPAAAKSKRKLSKRLSPYRYPGGKSKVIDYLYGHLQEAKSRKLVSPFTGGGSFELAMLEAGVVQELHLNDLDTGVYSFWWVVKHMPYVLIDRLNTVQPTHRDYFKAQALIQNNYAGADSVEAAWASILVNRLAYSGISKANPLGGRNGSLKNLRSRWNASELVRRIERIHELSDRIEVTQEDAEALIKEAYWDDEVTIFIDPPYVEQGKALYNCFYTERDHRSLAFLLDSLHHGMPGSDIVVTYDYNEWLSNLYEYPEIEIVGRSYSA